MWCSVFLGVFSPLHASIIRKSIPIETAGFYGFYLKLVLAGLGAGRIASLNILEVLYLQLDAICIDFSIRDGNLYGLTRGAEKVSGTQMASPIYEPGTWFSDTVLHLSADFSHIESKEK